MQYLQDIYKCQALPSLRQAQGKGRGPQALLIRGVIPLNKISCLPQTASYGMMFCNTGEKNMATAKVAVTIDEDLLGKLDRLVKAHVFPNRSRAIQEAVSDKLARLDQRRLTQECAKLDKDFEQAMAEEGLNSEVDAWPEY